MRFEHQCDADLQVIGALQRAGSNMLKPHKLEHHFVSKSRSSLDAVRNYAISQQLQVSDILSTGTLRKTYFFDVITNTVPTIESVAPITAEMHRLAAAHSCLYDGWGCSVEE